LVSLLSNQKEKKLTEKGEKGIIAIPLLMKNLLETSQEPANFVPEITHLAKERKIADVEFVTNSKHESIPDILDRTCLYGNDGLAFFAVDLGEPIRRIRRWKELLPRVEPYYAIKCNSNPVILKTLVDLGIGFDCASQEEISTMLKMGVDSSRIIFANPCKPVAYIQYASRYDVSLMTFDNADELYKIKQHYPTAKLVLRVLADDSRSVCRFGVKFGASYPVATKLLALARDLELNVIGVSFHVGSGCFDPTAFSDAVEVARKVFDQAAEFGFKMNFLDLGGGYPGLDGVDGAPFDQVAAALRIALEEFFPDPEIKIIAEPGRYVAAAAFTLAVSVLSRRVIPPHSDNEKPSYMYYVSDGVYGSFNCILFDHAKVFPKVLRKGGKICFNGNKINHPEPKYECSLWGPTCDSMDCISRKEELPELEVGDWLYFENMGAYTLAAASTFNGFPRASLIYTNTEN
jgi:ornithine decarboxylase